MYVTLGKILRNTAACEFPTSADQGKSASLMEVSLLGLTSHGEALCPEERPRKGCIFTKILPLVAEQFHLG